MALDTYDVPLGNIIIVNATLQLLNIAKRLVTRSISFLREKAKNVVIQLAGALHSVMCKIPTPTFTHSIQLFADPLVPTQIHTDLCIYVYTCEL